MKETDYTYYYEGTLQVFHEIVKSLSHLGKEQRKRMILALAMFHDISESDLKNVEQNFKKIMELVK